MGQIILNILVILLLTRFLMAFSEKIYYVSSNKFKLQTAQKCFNKFAPHFELVPLTLDFIEPQIIEQVSIAIAKAKQAYSQYKKPLLVDDVGFYINKYNNFPGTITGLVSRGLGFKGIKRLYDVGDAGYLRIVMVYIFGQDDYQVYDYQTDCFLIKPEEINSIGEIFIQIAIPNGHDKTFYDLMDTDAFYDVMPRNKALKEFLHFFMSGQH